MFLRDSKCKKCFELLYFVPMDSWISVIEFIAAYFGVISVWFSRKNDILVYPTGLISVLLYVYICFRFQLYADAFLNIYYTGMSILGWINWSRISNHRHKYPISYCNQKELGIGILLFICLEVSIYSFLIHFTNSAVPILDSLVSAFSALAMWWMATRKIENWIAWIIADALAIPLYYYKELYFTVGQYVIFLILATWGYIHWRREFKAIHQT